MRKLVCDACGAEIDSIYERNKDLDPAGRFVIRQTISLPDGTWTSTFLEYDLCQNCTNVVVEKIKENSQPRKRREYSFLGYRDKNENLEDELSDKNENLEDEET